MIIEDLSTLKIHKLTQEQYDRELDAGRVDPSALYLTPDNSVFVQNEEPIDAPDGALWVDMDETPDNGLMNGGDADTLDGYHAEDFALMEDVENIFEGIDETYELLFKELELGFSTIWDNFDTIWADYATKEYVDEVILGGAW